jgi:DNA repair exonuclease SbcCD ATPase subunit
MKIAIMADLQPTGDRLEEFRRQLDAAIDVAISNDCPILAIAGDVWEVGNIGDSHRPTGAILRAVCEPLRRYLNRHPDNHIVCVRGNHDTDNDGPDDGLVALEAMDPERVTVVRHSQWWRDRRLSIACLPWRWAGDDPDTPPDAEAELEALLAGVWPAEVPPPRLLLGHVQVLGARMNSLRACEGGNWIVSQEKLQSLVERHKIDRVALGDFHLRDVNLAGPGKGGYVGNLWQQNFSHESNPQGIEIWDADTGEVVWHELSEARRHSIWITNDPENVPGLLSNITNSVDFEKHRTWLKTDGFDVDRATKAAFEAEGIRVSAINIKRVERVARLENAEAMSLTDDRALLNGYIETRNIDLKPEDRKRIETALDEVIEENPRLAKGLQAERVATVTPLRTRVCGIGRHSDTEIVWDGLPELLVVHGSNGAGKTTAVGALYAALYNELPGYKGNLYDNLMAHGDGSALVEADFEVGGTRYRVRREIVGGNSKVPEQERWLYALDTGEVIAGPKDFDFRAAVDRIVGNAETALATWFMTAAREGDLTEIPPAERRALFGRFLGLERLDAVSDATGEKGAEVKARARQAETSLPSVDEAVRRMDEAADILRIAREGVIEARELVKQREADHAAKAATLEQLKSDDSALTAKVTEEERLHADARTIDRELELAHQEIAVLQKQAAGLEAATAAREQLEDARAEVKELEIQALAFEKRREWVRERQRRETEVTAKRDVVESLAQATGVDEETRILAASLEDLLAEHSRATEANATARREQDTWQKQRDGIAARLQRVGEELVRIEDQMKKKPETPFAEKCEPCPFMRAWADLPTRKAEGGRQCELIKLELRDHEGRKPTVQEIDLGPIIRRGEAARAAQRAIEQARQTEDKRVEAAERLKAAEKSLAAHERAEVPEAPNPSAQIVDARNRVDQFVRLAAGEESARTAAQMLASRRVSVGNLEERRSATAASLHAIAAPAAAAREALVSRETARTAAQHALDEAFAVLAAGRHRHDRANQELGTAEARHEEAISRRVDAVQARKDYEELLERQKAFEFLRRAFGREGIQPLLVEVSVPQLEAVASELLTEAFDRPTELAIRTQSETRKGDLIEDFRLEIADENGARDISRFSGGEREVFSLLLRLAIGLWLARRRGASLESVFVDEAFNKLDADRTARVVEILQRVARHFRRIVLLTPKADVAAHFPAQIRVTPRFDGCRIEYVGAQPATPIAMPTAVSMETVHA